MMKIVEILLDEFIHTQLFEMSQSRSEALRKLSDKSYQLDIHLIKILMYGNITNDYNKWCVEIDNWLTELQKIKWNRKKRLNYDTYKKYLWKHWVEYIDEVQDLMNEVSKNFTKNGCKPLEGNAANIHKQMEDILSNVCHDLTTNSFNSIKNYINVL